MPYWHSVLVAFVLDHGDFHSLWCLIGEAEHATAVVVTEGGP